MARVTTRRGLFAFTMAVGAVAVGAVLGLVFGDLSLRDTAYWLAAAVVGAGATILLIKKVRS